MTSEGLREKIARVIGDAAFMTVIQWMDREYMTEAQAYREVDRWEHARLAAFAKADAVLALVSPAPGGEVGEGSGSGPNDGSGA